MMRPCKTVAAFLFLVLVVPVTWAQSPEDGVRDLTGQDVTTEELVNALTPEEGPPPVKPGMRGLSVKPNCEFYRKKTTRGIAVKPAAQPVAVEILFAFNSANISPEAAANLDAIGQALTSAALAPCCFQLEGHTDAVGPDDYNLELSQGRAASVAAYLEQNYGIEMDRLLPRGLGEEQPIADNDTASGRQKNRRVQIVNLGYGQVEQ